ncbi:pilus assembly protein PilP [Desulfobacula phenolica]|uniref:Type IV pilus assembly protein PilP n=1 Tax=Desulfobacula phenolica TaxID=90732 RepID=A0A1H2DW89_9BACT|nr:pilus assembly protein PilP [Desulfobacula phenolica]SDT87135.1 type IV pilus assembly protein PilP [Desulfobacula phenolica]
MIRVDSKIILLILCGLIFLLFACDDPPPVKAKLTPDVVSGKISQSIVQNKLEKDHKKNKLNLKAGLTSKTEPIPKANPTTKTEPIPKDESLAEKNHKVSEINSDMEKERHYDFKGKTDPFKPLIQDKPEENMPIVDDRPKRILTPLEKIDLNQIRLVAVIVMKDRQIAMVEEATGKGYEVAIGTYIGKNQGRVSEIKNNSIVIKELVRDYKGRPKERVQEIKLHKNDNEE